VAPSSALGGVGGLTVTHLYWPVESAQGSDPSPSASHKHASAAPAQKKLHYEKTNPQTLAFNQDAIQPLQSPAESRDPGDAPAPGRSAGSAYGSLSEGADAGHDVRPALPVVMAEPMVNPSSLQGVAEGNCIVEITIDETGAVVAQNVVQTMGSVIDQAVLAAVSHWRFQPATRDGVPIPSKQDVVYHFKPRA
jgi:TonB family protein